MALRACKHLHGSVADSPVCERPWRTSPAAPVNTFRGFSLDTCCCGRDVKTPARLKISRKQSRVWRWLSPQQMIYVRSQASAFASSPLPPLFLPLPVSARPAVVRLRWRTALVVTRVAGEQQHTEDDDQKRRRRRGRSSREPVSPCHWWACCQRALMGGGVCWWRARCQRRVCMCTCICVCVRVFVQRGDESLCCSHNPLTSLTHTHTHTAEAPVCPTSHPQPSPPSTSPVTNTAIIRLWRAGRLQQQRNLICVSVCLCV